MGVLGRWAVSHERGTPVPYERFLAREVQVGTALFDIPLDTGVPRS